MTARKAKRKVHACVVCWARITLHDYDQARPHLINTDISRDDGGETPGGRES